MAVKTTGLGDKITVIITNKSKKIFQKYKKNYIEELNKAGEAWQETIRDILSVPTNYKRNTSANPKRRTGGLMNSIRRPHIKMGATTTRERGFYFEAKLQFTRLFSKYTGNGHTIKGHPDAKPKRMDVGDYLNDWEDKPFNGWKDRAKVLFNVEIESRTSQATKRNYFTRGY